MNGIDKGWVGLDAGVRGGHPGQKRRDVEVEEILGVILDKNLHPKNKAKST